MRTVATIGVYGWTLERFLDALHDADVGLLVDVRQRRGVRAHGVRHESVPRLRLCRECDFLSGRSSRSAPRRWPPSRARMPARTSSALAPRAGPQGARGPARGALTVP